MPSRGPTGAEEVLSGRRESASSSFRVRKLWDIKRQECLRYLRKPDVLMSLEHEIDARWPLANWGETRLLVAVSGGADSVALLHALLRLKKRVVGEGLQTASTAAEPSIESLVDVAHFNHGWRGTASDRDEAFVASLCQRLGVRFYVGRNTQSNAELLSKTEEQARDLRYAFLAETAYACGARYVVTGHTASDRVETVLHNLFRGTGLSGVAGPSLTRQLDRDLVLARPLIGCWREQIVDYLAKIAETHCEDASNADTQYRRNFLRHKLLPLLREEYGDQVDQRLCSFSELSEEAVLALRESAREYLRLVEALRRDAGRVGERGSAWLPALDHLDFAWVVVREGLREIWHTRGWKLQGMTRQHWDAVRELLEGKSGSEREASLNLPGNLVARREGAWVRISQKGE